MKRILLIIAAFLILFTSAFPVVAADGFEECLYARASRVEVAPKLDGVLLPSEYDAVHRLSSSHGLMAYCPTETGTLLSLENEAIMLDLALAFDEENLYVCAHLSMELVDSLARISVENLGECYLFTLKFSLFSPLESGFDQAYLSNTYYVRDGHCVDVFGVRTSLSGTTSETLAVISTADDRSFDPYVDENGVVWNADSYRDQTRVACNDGITLECKIPMQDLLRTVPESERERRFSALLGASEDALGTFSMESPLNAAFGSFDDCRLVTAVSTEAPSPLSSDFCDWNRLYFQAGWEPSALPSFVPLPVLWNQSVKTEKAVDSDVIEKEREPAKGISFTESVSLAATDNGSSEMLPEEVASDLQPPVSSDIPQDWEGLPEVFHSGADHTQIVYLSEQAKSSEETVEKKTTVGSVFLVGAGVLLFCAIISVAIVFRAADRDPKRQNNDKK